MPRDDGYGKKRSAEYGQKKRNQRLRASSAWRNRATRSASYSPYHQEGVSNDGKDATLKLTPRQSRSTTSVGSARRAEARSGYNRGQAKKSAKKVSRARKSAIDFGNR
jgi:hypothetical protein